MIGVMDMELSFTLDKNVFNNKIMILATDFI